MTTRLVNSLGFGFGLLALLLLVRCGGGNTPSSNAPPSAPQDTGTTVELRFSGAVQNSSIGVWQVRYYRDGEELDRHTGIGMRDAQIFHIPNNVHVQYEVMDSRDQAGGATCTIADANGTILATNEQVGVNATAVCTVDM
ncbi:MAG: hypothetical protein E6Q97_30000 [Desulfurellales bacterium]|nr:MAG: hypothetical protein E6Q97_30000 [Desulfurellales bacterium]